MLHNIYVLFKHSAKDTYDMITSENKLILQYLKTRRCKYYTLYYSVYDTVLQKCTWNKPHLKV